MTDQRDLSIRHLIESIPELTDGQIYWLDRVVTVYSAPKSYNLEQSDLFDNITLENFGDALRVHHCFSSEPFSKDKFEHVLTRVLLLNGRNAELASRGNPGHDMTLDGLKVSLKTKADKNIRENKLHISKFMELGGGEWLDNPDDLIGLRNQFLRHLRSYDRIMSLRMLNAKPEYSYELVEIPKELLLEAEYGELEMKLNSTQSVKPGYCYVKDESAKIKFSLYFDGGGERKLQIKNLMKQRCLVHATWSFLIPPEP